MLVLSRERDEQIIIGHNGEIVITVMRISPGKCSLGIEAPKEIPVNRLEVWQTIQRKKAEEHGDEVS